MITQVLENLFPGMSYTSSDGTWDNLVIEEPGFIKPGYDLYEYTLYKLTNVEAIKKFREERNALLDKSDKYMTTDYPHKIELNIQNWRDYRRALRDLPTTARPTLDTDGNLIGVEWPVAPNS